MTPLQRRLERRNARVVRWRKQGMKTTEIAVRLGLTSARVSQILAQPARTSDAPAIVAQPVKDQFLARLRSEVADLQELIARVEALPL